MALSDLLRPEGLLLDIAAENKADLLTQLSARVADIWDLDATRVLKKLTQREELGSTGIGRGIALPHCTCDGVQTPMVVFARVTPGVDYKAVDGDKVDLVMALLLPKDNTSQHLSALAQAARILRQPAVVKALRRASAPEEVMAIFRAAQSTAEEERRVEQGA
ncbi:PTS sugar transporter subunit IIA [Falsirhodobacter halotolerans]|uniref:PTS sugar transporter subunit IIA n=1 Tax=Falsirhodobacter halotolerans TaxID=1146892 RepID=UPI001FD49C9A|nr:PTS sugar transporter subunit IIA [Falsirhodobacter halotolerans]MCJ8138777.1 PTS sugar transporter subunit IIA [Falsirhodobacter halotolerans]